MLKGDGTIKKDSAILDNLPIGVFFFDEMGALVYKNIIAATLPIEKILKIRAQGISSLYHERRHLRVVRVDAQGGALITVEDVTDSRATEKKLEDAHKKMQEVLERERKFLEEISHNFFNPLCIAKGYLDLSIPSANPALRRKLEITKQAIIRVEDVVKHIVIEGQIYE